MGRRIVVANLVVAVGAIGLAASMSALAQTAAKPIAPVPTKQVRMSTGMARLDKPLDTRRAKIGDEVTAKLMDAIPLADGTTLPKEATLSGYVVEVQASQNGGDSRLVLLFNEVIVKGESRPIPVKVTIQGLRAPPVPGPDKTGTEEGILRSTAPNDPSGFTGLFEPQKEDIKDTSVPGVILNSFLRDSTSGTVTSLGKNTQLPLWTQIRIAISHLPPNAVIQ
jgi:hypothetical protein